MSITDKWFNTTRHSLVRRHPPCLVVWLDGCGSRLDCSLIDHLSVSDCLFQFRISKISRWKKSGRTTRGARDTTQLRASGDQSNFGDSVPVADAVCKQVLPIEIHLMKALAGEHESERRPEHRGVVDPLTRGVQVPWRGISD